MQEEAWQLTADWSLLGILPGELPFGLYPLLNHHRTMAVEASLNRENTPISLYLQDDLNRPHNFSGDRTQSDSEEADPPQSVYLQKELNPLESVVDSDPTLDGVSDPFLHTSAASPVSWCYYSDTVILSGTTASTENNSTTITDSQDNYDEWVEVPVVPDDEDKEQEANWNEAEEGAPLDTIPEESEDGGGRSVTRVLISDPTPTEEEECEATVWGQDSDGEAKDAALYFQELEAEHVKSQALMDLLADGVPVDGDIEEEVDEIGTEAAAEEAEGGRRYLLTTFTIRISNPPQQQRESGPTKKTTKPN